MASYAKIRIRRDTKANWEADNPVLALGEIAADMTQHRLKVGNGTSAWNSLDWVGPEIIDILTDDSTDKVLSAKQGKELKTELDKKASSTDLLSLQSKVNTLQTKVDSLDGNQDGGTIFGIGYTVDSYNKYGKPTKITFDDKVTATLTWDITQLQKITASTGEVIIMEYDEDGLIKGRKITKS